MTRTSVAGAAAWVAGRPITVVEVEDRLAALRSGAFGSRLPGPQTAEGRNARRWVLQLLCAEELARAELARRGIVSSGRVGSLALPRALALGGVAAAVLATVPEIGEVELGGTEVGVDDDAVRGYYERNSDLFADRGITFAQAREGIEAELRHAAADRAFAAWLERRTARDVVLAPGFEHPAEPGHADSTHRH